MAKLKYITKLLILLHLSLVNGILCILFEGTYINNISLQTKRIPKKLDRDKAISHMNKMYKEK